MSERVRRTNHEKKTEESVVVEIAVDRHPILLTAVTSTQIAVALACDRIARSKSEALASELPGHLAGGVRFVFIRTGASPSD